MHEGGTCELNGSIIWRGKEGGWEGERERGRKEEREGGREGEREGERERGRKGGREGEGREEGREGGEGIECKIAVQVKSTLICLLGYLSRVKGVYVYTYV